MEKTPEISQETLNDIKNQLEYYLSDDNLKRDAFFHQQISENPEGYLDLDIVLKCNKIIKAKWTKDNLIEGVKLSTEIELDSTKEKIRRKGNRALPELMLLKKKRKNEDFEEDVEKETNDPIILSISANHKQKEKVDVRWQNIKDEFQNLNPNLQVIYGRFSDNTGHFAVLAKKGEEFKFIEKFELEGYTFNISKTEGDALIDFWKEHGSHFEMCTKKKLKERKKDSKGKSASGHLSEGVTLGKDTYKEIVLIKSAIRKILSSTKDNEKLEGNNQAAIMDLLKYHHNYEEKTKDMDYITVGTPSGYGNSRCFMIVKKNGEKVDFSFLKCIEEIQAKHGLNK